MWTICTSILLYAEMGAKAMWAAAASGADIRGHPGGDLFAAAQKIRQPESRMCTWTNSICVLYIVFVIIWLPIFAHEVFTHLHYRNHCYVRHVNIIHMADIAISLEALRWAAEGAWTIAKTGGSTLRRTSMCTIQKHQSESIDVLQGARCSAECEQYAHSELEFYFDYKARRPVLPATMWIIFT